MGFAIMLGVCFRCGDQFSFNPMRVPSFKDATGKRQEVCLSCIMYINKFRVDQGRDAFIIPADAYEACDESELG